jgi:hypothetical protein
MQWYLCFPKKFKIEIVLDQLHFGQFESISRIESTFKAHERVSKETNPHTTSKCISTDIQGLMQKVHPKT